MQWQERQANFGEAKTAAPRCGSPSWEALRSNSATTAGSNGGVGGVTRASPPVLATGGSPASAGSTPATLDDFSRGFGPLFGWLGSSPVGDDPRVAPTRPLGAGGTGVRGLGR